MAMRLCKPCYQPHEICLTNLKTWYCAVVPDSTSFTWKPCDCGSNPRVNHNSEIIYYDDAEDPRRLPFDPNLDYRRHTDGAFYDHRVQNLYRNLQIANQLHNCCFTCFKYSYRKGKDCPCRFGYPRSEEELRVIFDKAFHGSPDSFRKGMESGYMSTKIDPSGRKRKIAVPPFNNAHLNSHARDPLLFIAQGVNMDIKFIQDEAGTVEYIGGYISKVERPDFDKVGNIYIKKIAGISRKGLNPSDQQKLNAIGAALLESQIVGATQMCFFLIGLPFILYSRTVEVINSLPKKDLNVRVHGSKAREFIPGEMSALNTGMYSHIGKRKAYEDFLEYNSKMFLDENGNPKECNVTFYALRTAYSTNLLPEKLEKSMPEMEAPLSIEKSTGFINSSEKSFRIGMTLFRKRRICLLFRK